jgi:hypothetical protein
VTPPTVGPKHLLAIRKSKTIGRIGRSPFACRARAGTLAFSSSNQLMFTRGSFTQ